jgi:hypothetical protein
VPQRLQAFAAVLAASLGGSGGHPLPAHSPLPRLAVTFVTANLKVSCSWLLAVDVAVGGVCDHYWCGAVYGRMCFAVIWCWQFLVLHWCAKVCDATAHKHTPAKQKKPTILVLSS